MYFSELNRLKPLICLRLISKIPPISRGFRHFLTFPALCAPGLAEPRGPAPVPGFRFAPSGLHTLASGIGRPRLAAAAAVTIAAPPAPVAGKPDQREMPERGHVAPLHERHPAVPPRPALEAPPGKF